MRVKPGSSTTFRSHEESDRPRQLSDGQRQRVNIARALMNEPELPKFVTA